MITLCASPHAVGSLPTTLVDLKAADFAGLPTALGGLRTTTAQSLPPLAPPAGQQEDHVDRVSGARSPSSQESPVGRDVRTRSPSLEKEPTSSASTSATNTSVPTAREADLADGPGFAEEAA